MRLTENQKKNMVKGFIDIFPSIANKEYQKRIWIEALGPEEDSFDDVCNDFFGVCDFIVENYKELGISETQYNLLVKFRDAFQQFSDDNDWPRFFIDTPEWTRITKMAEEILQAFNYQGSRK